jgi:streptogramin lyase
LYSYAVSAVNNRLQGGQAYAFVQLPQVPVTTVPTAPGPVPGSFSELTTFKAVGYATNWLVGPGPTAGSQRYYVSYCYTGSPADLVAIDPSTGAFQAFPCPDPKISTAWAMVIGPDGKIYLGTDGGGKILRFDPQTSAYVDLGRASLTESMIWQLTMGADRKLYGCTYPNAKLVRYDPQTGQMEDLGRMDATQQYARTIAASKDGFVYTWVGLSENHLVAYEISTGLHRDILPAQYAAYGVSDLEQAADGYVYANIAHAWFRLQGGTATPVSTSQVSQLPSRNRLSNGQFITSAKNGTITLLDPLSKVVTSHAYPYTGKEMSLFRLGFGPDGMLYGSTSMPSHLVKFDPVSGLSTTIGSPGSGEVYSFLASNNSLLMGIYAGLAPLMSYNPGLPFDTASPSNNPALISYQGANGSWRPRAMVKGPTGEILVGSVPGYGLTGGALTVLDPVTNQVSGSYAVIPGQSVVSLTVANGLVAGGTSIYGGGGSVPTATDAQLFLWDSAAAKVVFATVPVPGATNITDLVTAPNGLVFGIAGPLARENRLFVFDPILRTIIHRAELPGFAVNAGVYNSIGVGPDGKLYGLYPYGIFSIDPTTYEVRIVAKYTGGVLTAGGRVSAGFALAGRNIYFASGPRLVRYTLP